MTNLTYINKGSSTIRSKKITDYLFNEVSKAITTVYGPDHTGRIYSGGQDRRGKNARRKGTVRHDDYGQGGRAADVYIYDAAGVRLQGEALAPLVQYWLAAGLGGVGVEMGRGGIHLDEWDKPPSSKGGMFWYYKGTDRSLFNSAVGFGRAGKLPETPTPSEGIGRKSMAQSTTQQAVVVSGVATVAGASEQLKTIVGNVTETFGIDPKYIFVAVVLCALAWVFRERLVRWGKGDR